MSGFTKLFEIIIFLVCLHQEATKTVTTNGQCMAPENCAFLDCCCRMRGSYVYITCKSENKDFFPLRNPQFTYNPYIQSLEISGYTFEELPSRSFDGLQIPSLALINNTNFKTIKSDSFAGLYSVQEVTLIGQSVSTLEPNALDSLQNASVMTLSGQTTIDSVLLDSGPFLFLKTLYLRNFTKINSYWFVDTPELINLDMFYYPNIIEYPPPDEFFLSNPQLENIVLSHNNIIDLAPVLNWLQNTKDTLRNLQVHFNKIEVIPDEINIFTRLETVRLWANSIRRLTSDTFRDLKELVTLELDFNEISESPIDVFKHNSKLSVIYMGNNKLKRIHDLPQSTRYIGYDNQGGQLEELYDYQFDLRPQFPIIAFINGNDFMRFGNQTFCSRTDTSTLAPLDHLIIDYASLARMNLCLLRQLSLRNSYPFNAITIKSDSEQDLSQLCNCKFILFLDFYKFKMIFDYCPLKLDACKQSSNASIIMENVRQIDAECAALPEFECYRTPTTTPGNFAPQKLHLNLSIIFAGLFLAIFYLIYI